MLNFRGNWDKTKTYSAGDLVTYGASSYVANINIAAGQPPPSQNPSWASFVRGIRWRGGWNKTDEYLKDDAVAYDGSSYIAQEDVPPDHEPNSAGTTKWGMLTAMGLPGMTWRGEWASTTQYNINDAVSYEKVSYIATKKPPVGTKPTDTMYWQIIGKEVEDQAIAIASLVMSSVTGVGLLAVGIANAVMASKGNALSDAINVAQTAANAASQAAQAAQNTANTAGQAAQAAQNTADAANQAAQAAQNTADTASQAAQAAQNTANTANQAAQAAQSATNEAKAGAVDALRKSSSIEKSMKSLKRSVEGLVAKFGK